MNITEEALTFDDVLLVPDYSEILPRQASLQTQLTREIKMNIPVLFVDIRLKLRESQ